MGVFVFPQLLDFFIYICTILLRRCLVKEKSWIGLWMASAAMVIYMIIERATQGFKNTPDGEFWFIHIVFGIVFLGGIFLTFCWGMIVRTIRTYRQRRIAERYSREIVLPSVPRKLPFRIRHF